MSTVARSDKPLTLIRGEPFQTPVAWTQPSDGSAVDLTGMTWRAGVGWAGGNTAAQIQVDDPTTGKWTVAVPDTRSVPAARGAELRMTFTDTQGQTHDFIYPLLVTEP